MTVSSSTRKAGPYIGAGTTSTFPFAFKVFQASDVLVVKLNTSTQVQTTLTLTTDYTVSLNADQNANPGGNITLVAGNLATGYNLVISSQVPNTQGTDITNMGGFYPDVIENALDKVTIEVQQINETNTRSLTYPITDPNTATGVLPTAGDRAGQYLAFDAVGNPIATFNIPSYIYQGAKASDPTLRNDGAALVAGDLYYNTGTNRMRVYSGSAWTDIGVPVPVSIAVDTFNGNGSATAFTLSTTPAFSTAADVYISGVAQKLTTDYTISGTTLTFTTAPPSGTGNIYVKTLSSYAGGVPNNASVGVAQLSATGTPSSSTFLRGDNTWAQAGFQSGTSMLFQQTVAPTGWTKQTTHNDKALRVVSGTASSGGTTAFSTVFANQTPTINTSGLSAGATTLSTSQMPSHTHSVPMGISLYEYSADNTGTGISPVLQLGNGNGGTSGSQGGGGSHSHSMSGSATSSAITLNVQYVDLIIASKD